MAKKYNYKVKTDSWYDWKGVKPPERTAHMTEDEMGEAFKINLQDHKHDWYQRGNEISCDAGDYVHGKKIGVKVRLAGTGEDGEPLLVPVGPILRSDT